MKSRDDALLSRRRSLLASIALVAVVLLPGSSSVASTVCAEWRDNTGEIRSICEDDGSASIELESPGNGGYVRWTSSGSGTVDVDVDADGVARSFELFAHARISYRHYIHRDEAGRGSAEARASQRTRVLLDHWFRADGVAYSGGNLVSSAYWDREIRERGMEIIGPLDPRDGTATAATDTFAYFEPHRAYPPGLYDIEAFAEIAAVMPNWRSGYGNSIQSNDYGRWIRPVFDFVRVPSPACGEGGICSVPADVDGSGEIDVADLSAWTDDPVDVNADDQVDGLDLAVFVAELEIAPTDCDDDGQLDAVQAFREPCLDSDGDGALDACQATVGDPVSECVVTNPPRGPRGIDVRISPSPFNPRTTIAFETMPRQRYDVTVYDVRGRRVARLAEGIGDGSSRQVTWDGSQLTSGVYFVRVVSGSLTRTERAVLVK